MPTNVRAVRASTVQRVSVRLIRTAANARPVTLESRVKQVLDERV